MARRTREWIGKTDDTKVPAHVRLRIFRREGGVCHLSGRKIAAGEEWHLDHKTPLRDGGEHRETNLSPALAGPHRSKTAKEATDRAKVDRIAAKHIGIRKPKGRPMPGTKASGIRIRMDGTTERRDD